ncbi:MAG: FHA domain-containing protein [Acidimicrobiales bacterium]
MPDALLTVLKFCFLAVLYLFFARVLRAVWVEMSGRHQSAPEPENYAAPTRPGRRTSRTVSRLAAIEPAALRGRTFDLTEELTMGRASGCHISLDDTFVSQLHARVFRREGRVWIEDLGSTNGTHLNHDKVTSPVAVRRGDRIQVGQTVLEVN